MYNQCIAGGAYHDGRRDGVLHLPGVGCVYPDQTRLGDSLPWWAQPIWAGRPSQEPRQIWF
jgi:hypothetical protein